VFVGVLVTASVGGAFVGVPVATFVIVGGGVGDAVPTLVVVGVAVATLVGRGVVVGVDAGEDDAARNATTAARPLTVWGKLKVAPYCAIVGAFPSSVKRALQHTSFGWTWRKLKPVPAVGLSVRMLVKVEAPKRRSFACVVGAVKPEETTLFVALAWATPSTAFVGDTPRYSWAATLMLPVPCTFTVTVKFEPPLAFVAYQILRGSSPPVAGEGSSTALL
jgi:hypothetical protein